MAAEDDNLLAVMAANIAWVGEPDCTPEEIADVLGKVEAHYKRAAELRDSLKDAMVQHIEATGQDLVIGQMRYWASYPTETKNRPQQKQRTFSYLLDACDGDLDALCDCLYADPFKTSKAKELLTPEEFSECFEVTTKAKLSSGPLKKQLMSVNTEYVK